MNKNRQLIRVYADIVAVTSLQSSMCSHDQNRGSTRPNTHKPPANQPSSRTTSTTSSSTMSTSSSHSGIQPDKKNSTACARSPTTTPTASCYASAQVTSRHLPHHTSNPVTGRLARLTRKRRIKMGRRNRRELPRRASRARGPEVRLARSRGRRGGCDEDGTEETNDRLQARSRCCGEDQGA